MTIATAPKAPALPIGPEIRSMRGTELRAVTEGTTKYLEGYAAVFNSPSEDMGGWVEIIKPGAFARALREKQDVRCVIDHGGAEVLLGRTASGTLELREDMKGLWYRVKLPDTQAARDIVALVERGDISGNSFRFRVKRAPDGTGGVQWVFPPEGRDERHLLDVDLYDVGPVMEPAYPATDVQVRSRMGEERDAAKAAQKPRESMENRRRYLELAEAE
jgi:HK97 family phage prohead protease